jgi:hypothetical protein
VIDEALRGDRGAHSLLDHMQHLDRALPAADISSDPIAHADRCGGLGGTSVHADVAATACLRGLRSRLVQADRPEPAVNPSLHRNGPDLQVVGDRVPGLVKTDGAAARDF